jgi:hypothetical protein
MTTIGFLVIMTQSPRGEGVGRDDVILLFIAFVLIFRLLLFFAMLFKLKFIFSPEREIKLRSFFHSEI